MLLENILKRKNKGDKHKQTGPPSFITAYKSVGYFSVQCLVDLLFCLSGLKEYACVRVIAVSVPQDLASALNNAKPNLV